MYMTNLSDDVAQRYQRNRRHQIIGDDCISKYMKLEISIVWMETI